MNKEYIWLNEFKQANIWEILERKGDKMLCRLAEVDREKWFSVKDAIGFWVWLGDEIKYCFERRGDRVLVDVAVNGCGEDVWVYNKEIQPLTLQENIEFATGKILSLCSK